MSPLPTPIKKIRKKPTPKTQTKVLSEFNHLCAICGGLRPQIHHIDGNPSNNEELNLIPLCPNHHLIDAHSPTEPIHPLKLLLFRKYRDPAILFSQFDPIFKRMQFLLDPAEGRINAAEIKKHSMDLLEFISYLKMGEYYVDKLKPYLIWNPPEPSPYTAGHQQPTNWLREALREIRERPFKEETFLEKYEEDKEKVAYFIIEMLRYQKWKYIDPFKN